MATSPHIATATAGSMAARGKRHGSLVAGGVAALHWLRSGGCILASDGVAVAERTAERVEQRGRAR